MLAPISKTRMIRVPGTWYGFTGEHGNQDQIGCLNITEDACFLGPSQVLITIPPRNIYQQGDHNIQNLLLVRMVNIYTWYTSIGEYPLSCVLHFFGCITGSDYEYYTTWSRTSTVNINTTNQSTPFIDVIRTSWASQVTAREVLVDWPCPAQYDVFGCHFSTRC